MSYEPQGGQGVLSRENQGCERGEIPARSRERVEEYITDLTAAYPSFPVNQTTVSVSGQRYTDIREQEHGVGGFVDAYLQIPDRDGDRGVLHVTEDGHTDLPGVRVGLDESPEHRIQSILREELDLECIVNFPKRATITGVRNAENNECEPLYHVVLVFEGTHVAGTVGEGAVWKQSISTIPVLAR